jgi:hypothetical protein
MVDEACSVVVGGMPVARGVVFEASFRFESGVLVAVNKKDTDSFSESAVATLVQANDASAIKAAHKKRFFVKRVKITPITFSVALDFLQGELSTYSASDWVVRRGRVAVSPWGARITTSK